jgi:hypothetical protein
MVALSDQKPEPAAVEQQATAPEIDPAAQLQLAVQDLKAFFSEMTVYARYYLSLQVDRAKFASKRVAFYAIAGVLGLVVLAAFLAVGTCLLLIGVAGLIGHALDSFWIGATIVGVLMFILPAGGLMFTWSYLNKKAIKALEEKYARMRDQQRDELGHDVKEVAHG